VATSGPSAVIPPEPPAELSKVKLRLGCVAGKWFRLSPNRHPSPLFWSRLGWYRFDSPTARWGVSYSAHGIRAAFQEVFGDKIRAAGSLDYPEVEDITVWLIETPSDFRGVSLYGETLTLIGATEQSFVSDYAISQRWGAELMHHPADLDGLVYHGRQCGEDCLAMFGDESASRPYQKQLTVTPLGDLVAWSNFWPMIERLGLRITTMPRSRRTPTWT